MRTDTPKLYAWLYTSALVQPLSWPDVVSISRDFAAANKIHGVTGFLISDGKTAMQYVEGTGAAITTLKKNIEGDARHHQMMTESYTSLDAPAFPEWSMKVVHPSDYESLYANIDAAGRESIGVQISRMIFDTMFNP